MRIYKEKQFLVFDFEDGKTVKYDFATKTAIGKKGKPVANLCSQLNGLTINTLIENCDDAQYGKFLKFVKKHGDYFHRGIENIGTILSRVPDFARFEQIFSAGIEDIVSPGFKYSINDIPKALIKLCKKHEIVLSNVFIDFYNDNPDGYLLAYNLEYTSLTDRDIKEILSSNKQIWNNDRYSYDNISKFNFLINEYGYTAKALMFYLDYCKTYEAIDNMDFLLTELCDYANMMNSISSKFDKYPRHFLTTHKIACRNYNRLKEQFDEEVFKTHINKSMERTIGEYIIVYPNSTQDIKDEAVSQNNCVASYIEKVLNGECDILFLRKKDNPTKSLVTLEVRNGRIVQAKQRFNDPVTVEQQGVIDKWNDWFSKKALNKKTVNGFLIKG